MKVLVMVMGQVLGMVLAPGLVLVLVMGSFWWNLFRLSSL